MNLSVAPRATTNIEERVKVAYYLRYSYSYLLLYKSEEKVYVQEFWTVPRDAPFIRENSEAEQYLEDKERQRLEMAGIERPNSKWSFLRFHKVHVKILLTRSPLLGSGPLPEWLRNLAHGRAMVTLDSYDDNLCLWRCISVYKGARVDRCSRVAKAMAKRYYRHAETPNDVIQTSLDDLDKVEKFLNERLPASDWIGIRVYFPRRDTDGTIVWAMYRNPVPFIKNIMTIGVHSGHAFLIKDIKKWGKIYKCAHCFQQFTNVCNLQRHDQTCKKGETIMVFTQLSELPTTAYQKAFYPKNTASKHYLL